MGISRTEVNLLRLLESAPRQQNQAKIIHYVTTSRELLEHLAAETTSEGISSLSKGKLNEYSDKIEDLAARLRPQVVVTVSGARTSPRSAVARLRCRDDTAVRPRKSSTSNRGNVERIPKQRRDRVGTFQIFS